MGLRETAESDLGKILNDSATGFAWSINVTDPASKSEDLKGLSNDIHQAIDPDTGQIVSGRVASVALRLADLTAAGFTSIPRNISDDSSRPWIIKFDDINGNAFTFKVSESNPDRALGAILCFLEIYK